MEKETTINGFTVTFMDFGDSNNCYVQKGKFSHSLALLQDLGGFEDDEGNTLDISPATIDKIEAWALAQGY